MISGLNSQRRTTSQTFTPNGIYLGIVKRVDSATLRVWVELPRIAEGAEFGPLNTIMGVSPSVGDTVACMFMENNADDLIVLGVVNDRWNVSRTTTSDTAPGDPRSGDMWFDSGTSTFYIFSDGSWVRSIRSPMNSSEFGAILTMDVGR